MGSTVSLKGLSTILIIGLLVCGGPVLAQRSSELSVDLPDAKTLATQRKVEDLFKDGEYDRAFFIYRNELVPIGDKYAQYMVGYMFESGIGTDKDVLQASAWYRLAADRDTPEFVAVRDQLLSSLDDGERAISDLHYLELRRQYSDLAVLMNSIRRDSRALEGTTGTRLSGETSPVTIIDVSRGGIRSSAAYYSNIRRRLKERMKLVIEIGGFDDALTEPTSANIRRLSQLVLQELESDVD